MLHRLRHKEFQIHEAAIAEHHDEEAQFPACAADCNCAKLTPVDLCGFSGGKREREESLAVLRPYQAHIVLDGRVAAQIAGFTQSLEDLLRAERMGVYQTGYLSFEWVKQAGAHRLLPCFVVQHMSPSRHGAMRQMQCFCDLGQGHMLAIAVIPDLAPGFIGNHARLRRTAWRAARCSRATARLAAGAIGTGASLLAAVGCSGAGGGGNGSPRASTWYSGLA